MEQISITCEFCHGNLEPVDCLVIGGGYICSHCKKYFLENGFYIDEDFDLDNLVGDEPDNWI